MAQEVRKFMSELLEPNSSILYAENVDKGY